MSRLSSQMLLDVYGCAEDPQRWRNFLDGMCEKFEVRSAVAQIFLQDGFQMRQHWAARDTFSLQHAAHHDAWVNNEENPRTDLRLLQHFETNAVVRDSDLFPVGCPHFDRLKTRLTAVGLGQSVALNIQIGAGAFFWLVLHRACDNDRPFMQDDENFLRELVPHLQQMLQLSAVREDTILRLSTYEEAINSLHTGVIVCDADSRVTWLNAAAEQMVHNSPYLTLGNGFLRCSSLGEERKLRDLISQVYQEGDRPSIRSAIAFGGEPDSLQIVAFPSSVGHGIGPWIGDRKRVVLLVSVMGRSPTFSVDEVARLFSLSPAEASLAAALSAGQSVSDYALGRGISVGTARIQLKSVLSKTNTRRQADLVRQICCSIVAQTNSIMN